VACGCWLFGTLTPARLARPSTGRPFEKPGERKGFRKSAARRKGGGDKAAFQAVEYHPEQVRSADVSYEFGFIDQRSAVFAGQS